MKRMVLILLALPGFALFAQKLTLEQSLKLGIENSKALKVSKSKVISSDSKITEATSQLLPQFKFAAGYSRLSDIPPFEVRVPFSPVPIRLSDVILNNYNLRLSFQQPLFTGFRLSSLRSAAVLNSKAAEFDYTADYNETAFKIYSTFWNFYKAQQVLIVINENLEQIKMHLDDTKNFLENGLATQNDVLKLEVQYSNTRLQQIEAENNLDVARYGFNQALGITPESPTEIETGDISFEEFNLDFTRVLEEAKNSRNEIKSMKYRLEASNKGITASQAGWFPSIYLSGNYYYNRPNQRIMPVQDKFNDTWDVNVSLSWDIWNWGLTSSQSTQAEQTRIQTENSLAHLDDAIEIEVYQNFLQHKRSHEKILVSRTSMEQAKENYRTIKEKYNVQLATSTDLIDAEAALLMAETNYTNALVDNQISKARLEKSIGRRIY